MILLIIVGVVLLILIVWLIGAQRNLVKQDELCRNALSQIGVQQNSRWDALTGLAQLTKSYSRHEYETLMQVIGQRRIIDGRSSAADVEAQEDMLSKALSKIVAIAEAYPDLKAQQSYSKTMDSVNIYENNVRMSRMVYNDSVTKYNRLIRQIPTNFAAGFFKFGLRDYLETEAARTTMPDLSL